MCLVSIYINVLFYNKLTLVVTVEHGHNKYIFFISYRGTNIPCCVFG